jgi:hypothetical protein
VRACGAGPTGFDVRAELLLEVTFQFAPRAVPDVGYGTTKSTWTVEPAAAGDAARGPVGGVRITQAWDELDLPSALAVPADGVVANLDRSIVTRDGGFAYATPLWQQLPAGMEDLDPRLSALRVALFENGRPLGPGDAARDEIAAKGRGRFGLEGEALLFSASDGTDPRDNDRIYSVVVSRAPGAGVPASD